jgi:hypothetical protein
MKDLCQVRRKLVARNHFLDALRDPVMRTKLLESAPPTLSETLTKAIYLEAISCYNVDKNDSEDEPKRQKSKFRAAVVGKSAEESPVEKELKQQLAAMRVELDKLKQGNTALKKGLSGGSSKSETFISGPGHDQSAPPFWVAQSPSPSATVVTPQQNQQTSFSYGPYGLTPTSWPQQPTKPPSSESSISIAPDQYNQEQRRFVGRGRVSIQVPYDTCRVCHQQ